VLKNWVKLQAEYPCLFFVADWHALTTDYEQPGALQDVGTDMVIDWLAAGVDPSQATLFVQSLVPEHAELHLLLSMMTPLGWLERVPTYKDQQEKLADKDLATYGFLGYPLLQAADILIYQADRVPVGEDQRQHLELTRDVAERFNARFGQTFAVPEAYIPKVGGRVMDLQDPTAKMSKSGASAAGRIQVLDPPEVIRKKIRSAVTDSGREVVARPDKPAIANLLELFSVTSGRSVGELEQAYAGRGYGDFKADLAEAVIACLAPLQERYHELRDDPAHLAGILEAGAAKAQAVARANLALAKERMGFLPRGPEGSGRGGPGDPTGVPRTVGHQRGAPVGRQR